MELYEVLRTTFAAREFTADPLPDEVLAKILDQARFAPSGGNRQGWHVIVVRDAATKRRLADLSAFAGRRYAAQAANGENPWNTIDPPRVDHDRARRAGPLRRSAGRGLDRSGSRARRDHQRGVDLSLRVEHPPRGAAR